MNIQQVARINTVWMDRPPLHKVANVLVITSLLCLLVLIGLICVIATGISLVHR